MWNNLSCKECVCYGSTTTVFKTKILFRKNEKKTSEKFWAHKFYKKPLTILIHHPLSIIIPSPLILAKTGRKIRLKLNWVFEYSWQQNLHWVSDEIFPCPVLNKNFQLGKVPSKIILLASEYQKFWRFVHFSLCCSGRFSTFSQKNGLETLF